MGWLVVIGVVVVVYLGSDEPRPRLNDLSEANRTLALALAAAVTGAALAFLWNFALKRRDERREQRAVYRLVDLELAEAAALLDPHKGGTGKRVWDHPELQLAPRPKDNEWELVEQAGGLEAWQAERRRGLLRVDAWHDHKLLLARHVTYPEWDRLRRAYTAIEHVKGNVTEPTDSTLDAIDMARASTLHRIDRARGVLERRIGDRADDPHSWLEGARDQASLDAQSGPPRVVGVGDLARELRSAVGLGRLSVREAESLGGYLLMRANGAVPRLSKRRRKLREAQVRDFGFVLRSGGTGAPKEETLPRDHQERPS